jgi:hypothetical protein
MPNWVSNSLTISGPPEDIDRFAKVAGAMTRSETKKGPPKVVPVKGKRKAKAVEDDRSFRPEVFTFNHFVPQPRKFPKCIPKGHPGTPKWMRWRAKYWGTKWEPCWPDVKRVYRNRIRYWFSTAWYAPIEFFYKVSRMYPTLIFRLRYWEDGKWQPRCEFSKGKGYVVEKDSPTK